MTTQDTTLWSCKRARVRLAALLHSHGLIVSALVFCARLAPLQVEVGTPGGTETVTHALASALAEDPETVVI